MRCAAFCIVLGLLTGACAGACGCASLTTYPPVTEADTLSEPTAEPIPTLMAGSIRYAHERHGSGLELIINLPPGTPAEVYDLVIEDLGGGRPMQSADEPAYHVLEVRARGWDAEVDLIYPRRGGSHEFVTVMFEKKLLGDYRIASTRLWRIRRQTPPPNYSPAAEES